MKSKLLIICAVVLISLFATSCEDYREHCYTYHLIIKLNDIVLLDEYGLLWGTRNTIRKYEQEQTDKYIAIHSGEGTVSSQLEFGYEEQNERPETSCNHKQTY